MATRKRCPGCGNDFIGKANATTCSTRCRSRVHRSRSGTVATVPAVAPERPVAHAGDGTHCAEALAMRRALEEELFENAADRGLSTDDMSWSAAERITLEMAMAAVDRKADLQTRYAAATEDGLRVKLSGEIRLLEASVARLLKQVSTDLPPEQSQVSRKAAKAANTRWGNGTR